MISTLKVTTMKMILMKKVTEVTVNLKKKLMAMKEVMLMLLVDKATVAKLNLKEKLMTMKKMVILLPIRPFQHRPMK